MFFKGNAVDISGGTGDLVDFKIINVDTSSSPQTVTILSADIAIDGILFIIKDISNNASVNNIRIETEGSEMIDITIPFVDVTANSGGLTVYTFNGGLFTW